MLPNHGPAPIGRLRVHIRVALPIAIDGAFARCTPQPSAQPNLLPLPIGCSLEAPAPMSSRYKRADAQTGLNPARTVI